MEYAYTQGDDRLSDHAGFHVTGVVGILGVPLVIILIWIYPPASWRTPGNKGKGY